MLYVGVAVAGAFNVLAMRVEVGGAHANCGWVGRRVSSRQRAGRATVGGVLLQSGLPGMHTTLSGPVPGYDRVPLRLSSGLHAAGGDWRTRSSSVVQSMCLCVFVSALPLPRQALRCQPTCFASALRLPNAQANNVGGLPAALLLACTRKQCAVAPAALPLSTSHVLQ